MNNEILGSASSSTETLQNELCLMKNSQSSHKFNVESQGRV